MLLRCMSPTLLPSYRILLFLFYTSNQKRTTSTPGTLFNKSEKCFGYGKYRDWHIHYIYAKSKIFKYFNICLWSFFILYAMFIPACSYNILYFCMSGIFGFHFIPFTMKYPRSPQCPYFKESRNDCVLGIFTSLTSTLNPRFSRISISACGRFLCLIGNCFSISLL